MYVCPWMCPSNTHTIHTFCTFSDPNNTINTNVNKAAPTHTYRSVLLPPSLYHNIPHPPLVISCQRLWNTCNTAFLPVRQQKHSESTKTVQGQRCTLCIILPGSIIHPLSQCWIHSISPTHPPSHPHSPCPLHSRPPFHGKTANCAWHCHESCAGLGWTNPTKKRRLVPK